MQLLSQRDPRWSGITLGTGSTTIGQDGCFITVIAMLVGTTPDVINQIFIEKGVYDNGNQIVWDRVQAALPGVTLVNRVWSYNNDDVKANVPCLVQVDATPIGGTIHAVAYVGNQKLYDPWDGTEKSTDTYVPENYCIIKGTLNQPTSPSGSMFTLPSGSQVDLSNAESMKVCATTWDEVVNFHDYVSATQYNTDVKSKQDTIDNLNQQIKDRNNNITTLNGQIQTAQTQIDSLEQQVSTLQPIAATVPNLKAQLAQALIDRQTCLDANAKQEIVINNLKSTIAAGKPKTFWAKVQYVLFN